MSSDVQIIEKLDAVEYFAGEMSVANLEKKAKTFQNWYVNRISTWVQFFPETLLACLAFDLR